MDLMAPPEVITTDRDVAFVTHAALSRSGYAAIEGAAAGRPGRLLFALACLVPALFLGVPGTGDMGIWAQWMADVDRLGFVGGYAAIADVQPPLNSVFLGVVSWLSHGLGFDPLLGVKVSTLLALYLTGALVAYGFRSWLAGAVVVLVFTVNVGLGYLDIWYAPFLVLALLSLRSGRVAWFAFWFAIAAMVKAQPLILAPFLVVCALQQPVMRPDGRLSWRRILSQLVAPGGVVLVPLAVLYAPSMVAAMGYAASGHYLNGHAFNLAMLLNYVANVAAPDGIGAPGLTDGMLTLIPPEPLGGLLRILFAAVYGLVLVTYIRRRDPSFRTLLEFSALGFLCYFALNSGVHENHLFVFVLLLGLLAVEGPAYRPWFVVFAILSIVNLLLFYGLTGTGPGFVRTVGGLDVAVPLAAVMLGCAAGFFVRVLHRPDFHDARSPVGRRVRVVLDEDAAVLSARPVGPV
jgi:hypothetical protein